MEIQDASPTWESLLLPFLRHSRSHQPSYILDVDKKASVSTLYLILNLLSHAVNPVKSSVLQSILDSYLITNGVKRAVVETLAGLNLCHGHTTANARLIDIAASERLKLSKIAKDLRTVVACDNMDFTDTLRDESLGHQSRM